MEDPTFPGIWVRARPLGVFWMRDEEGPDAKIVCAPCPDRALDPVEDLDDLPRAVLDEVEQFFAGRSRARGPTPPATGTSPPPWRWSRRLAGGTSDSGRAGTSTGDPAVDLRPESATPVGS
ncbi:MAG: inorganic diphosphatase [Acidimicrobiales bacterium]